MAKTMKAITATVEREKQQQRRKYENSHITNEVLIYMCECSTTNLKKEKNI